MKIFEKIQYSDGGPNDKGKLIGHVKGESKEGLQEEIGNGFIKFFEIETYNYNKRKEKAMEDFKRNFPF